MLDILYNQSEINLARRLLASKIFFDLNAPKADETDIYKFIYNIKYRKTHFYSN